MRVLALSHAADRSGAPISTLSLLKSFVDKDWSVKALLRQDGALRSDYESVCDTEVFRAEPRFGISDFVQTGLDYDVGLALKCLRNPDRAFCLSCSERSNAKRLRDLFAAWAPDVIYVSSTFSADMLPWLPQGAAPIILHVRELGPTLDLLDARQRRAIQSHADHIVCVSERVAGEFNERFDGFGTRTSIEPPAVIPPSESYFSPPPDIPDDAILVIGVGTIEQRKGTDLFVRAAINSLERWRDARPLIFIWIGDGTTSEKRRNERLIQQAGMQDNILFIGQIDNLESYYLRSSVVLCTSREDPYPRILIEAGMAGKRVVAFAGSGGADDYIQDFDAGRLVASSDPGAMTEALFKELKSEGTSDSALAARIRAARSCDASADRLEMIFREAITQYNDKHPGRFID